MTQSFIHIESPNYLRAGSLHTRRLARAFRQRSSGRPGNRLRDRRFHRHHRSRSSGNRISSPSIFTTRAATRPADASMSAVLQTSGSFGKRRGSSSRERIPAGSLAAVYINCPDPWPKKKHRKRRLVNRAVHGVPAEFLLPGGDFFFATDFDDYGIDVAGMMPGIDGFANMLAPDLLPA